MLIHVTAEDIAQGKRADCCFCPIALALRRQLSPHAWVGLDIIQFPDNKEIPLPQSGQDFIYHFDNGRSVTPFSFEIPEIPSCIPLANQV